MSMTQLPRVAAQDEQHDAARTNFSDDLNVRLLGTPARRAVLRTRRWLLSQQHADGFWCAELEGDTILESETILLLAFLGEEQSTLAERLAKRLLDEQLPEGGWSMYPGGEVEISGSVKAYFALKLVGYDPSDEPMQRARAAILAHGGADAVNSFTRFYLALLGQISYDQCPEVPPEAVLLPKWLPVSLHQVSSWSRTIIVPLSIVSALRPVRELSASQGIRELFLRDPEDWPRLRCPGLPGGTGPFSWDFFFRTVDRALKWCRRHRLMPLRRRAVAAAHRWIVDRLQKSDGLGAIYPPIVWSLVALKAMGRDLSEEMTECRRQLDALVIDDEQDESARVQPCKSPVWDTSITLRALRAAGLGPNHPAIARGVCWLLDRQTRSKGDWSDTVDAEPGGWYFEHNNEFYPDTDDTAMVLMALKRQFDAPGDDELNETVPRLELFDADDEQAEAPPLRGRFTLDDSFDETETEGDAAAAVTDVDRLQRVTESMDRGLRWLLAMQNDDGGWGAFDRNNNAEFLCYVPFADHNAMIDPSTPDLTARVLESLGELGLRQGHAAVDRAVDYLRHTQEADGSWYGRWGVNYIYGTWQVITGLIAVGVSPDDPAIEAAVNWLLAHQQETGGWGESPESYEKPHLRGQGEVTASQTAWAVLGLIAAGEARHPATVRGVRFLALMQQADGTWDEPQFTGTGFPRVFYLRYHDYPIYFPLMALGQWLREVKPRRNAAKQSQPAGCE